MKKTEEITTENETPEANTATAVLPSLNNTETASDLGDSKAYEIGFLLSPLVASDTVTEAVNEEIVSKIEKMGGKIQSRVTPEMKKLAYTISHTVGNNNAKYNDAYFGALVFNLEAQDVIKLSTDLKLSEKIIRFMVIALPKGAPKSIAKPEIAVKRSVKKDKETSATPEEIDKKIDDLLETQTL